MISFNELPVKADQLKSSSFLGNTISILKNPVNFLGELSKSYGPIVITKFVSKRYYILQHPTYIKHVLLDNHKRYSKPGTTTLLNLFLGEGLVTSNGDSWLKQRRMIQPTFNKQRLDHMLQIINEEATLFIEQLELLPDNTSININEEFLKLNITIISRTMFGTSLAKEMPVMIKELKELNQYAFRWMKSLIKIPANWPTPSNIKFKRNCQVFDGIIYKIIERRKKYKTNASLPPHDDLLDMLVDYIDEDTKEPLTDHQIRDQVTTIFMGGHETTSQTLNWIFYHLAKEKEIMQKVKHEATNVLNDRLPSFNDLSQLKFTKQVIQEAMRCYPSIYALIRKPYCDDEINGLKITSSSNVLVNIYGMHHHPHYWDTPDTFNPEHFNDESVQNRPQFVYLPFGAGPRLCIGSNFAMMVMQVIVSRLSLCFDFDVPENYKPTIEPSITMRAKDGMKLIIRKRA